MIISTMAMISNKQQALFLALFWYRFACVNSTSAPLVSFRTFSTFRSMASITSPCSLTMVATSRKSSLSSLTPCSMFLISASRSMIRLSWKSTSDCGARRGSSICCCCCCCCWEPPSPEGEVASSSAAFEARSFSRARRWMTWNSTPADPNSRDSFWTVYFCEGCHGAFVSSEVWKCSVVKDH